jgi:hypothetical protein
MEKSTTAQPTKTGLKEWLPRDFTPGPHDVQVGRGRKVNETAGNIWFRMIVKSVSASYLAATSKARKSEILTTGVLAVLLEKNGQFIKKDAACDRYYLLQDHVGRITAAQAMRDCLSNSYRSSCHSKRKKRKENEINNGGSNSGKNIHSRDNGSNNSSLQGSSSGSLKMPNETHAYMFALAARGVYITPNY